MSQVATKRKIKIEHEQVKVTARFHEQGSVLRGDAEGFCDGFDVEIKIGSLEPGERIEELVEQARRMCFTEKALVGETPVTVRLFIDSLPA